MKTHRRNSILLILLSLAPVTARADYGYIADYKKLVTRFTVDFYKTDQNFANDSVLEDIAVGATKTKLSDTRFLLNVEYGVAQDFELGLQTGFSNTAISSIATGDNLLVGNGLVDTTISVKWNFKALDPVLTAEVYGTIPFASTKIAAGDALVTDGSINIGAKFHTGHRAGIVTFALSPGFVLRSNGYSSAITGDASVGVDFKKGWLRGFGSILYSIEETRLNDSSLTKHDTLGTGGSYARMSGSPFGIFAGGELGFRLIEELVLSGHGTHAIYGTRYPNFFQFGFTIGYTFDLFSQIKAKRVKDVPFEEDQDDFYKNR